MTTHRSFKQRVRARMTKTGESYTAARRMLIAGGDQPEAVNKAFKARISDEKVREATGRSRAAWFGLLDTWGAVRCSHREIARHLVKTYELDGWWSQMLTVDYELARGLREPGQHADGWHVSASKTIEVPVTRLYKAMLDEKQRSRWLPGAELHLRTATASKSARFDWEDGSTRVNVGFTKLGASKSQIAIGHERLPDAETAEEMKRWWRERVAALKPMLEGGEIDG